MSASAIARRLMWMAAVGVLVAAAGADPTAAPTPRPRPRPRPRAQAFTQDDLKRYGHGSKDSAEPTPTEASETARDSEAPAATPAPASRPRYYPFWRASQPDDSGSREVVPTPTEPATPTPTANPDSE